MPCASSNYSVGAPPPWEQLGHRAGPLARRDRSPSAAARRGSGDVAERVGTEDRIERGVLERQLVSVAYSQISLDVEPNILPPIVEEYLLQWR